MFHSASFLCHCVSNRPRVPESEYCKSLPCIVLKLLMCWEPSWSNSDVMSSLSAHSALFWCSHAKKTKQTKKPFRIQAYDVLNVTVVEFSGPRHHPQSCRMFSNLQLQEKQGDICQTMSQVEVCFLQENTFMLEFDLSYKGYFDIWQEEK